MNKIKNNLYKKTVPAIKILVILAVFLCVQTGALTNTFTEKANAQGYSPSGTGQEVLCRGDRNWAAYGVALWNQFMDPRDFWEYWKDITVRYFDNFCLYEDIYGLIKRADKAREQVRKAFYNCTSTDKIVNSYYRIESEIYFLRYYIDYVQVTSDDGSKKPNYFIKPIDNDWQDFNGELIPTEAQRTALYNEYYAKYNGRMDTYNKCKDPGIENLIFKFKEDMDYLANTAKAAGKSISQKANRLKDTASGLVKAVKSGEYFTGMLQASINGMPCPVLGMIVGSTQEVKEEKKKECAMAIQDIRNAINQNMPNWSGLNFYDLKEAANNVAEQATNLTDDTENLSKYEFLYYESSDNIVQEFSNRLKSLNNIISGSTNSPKYLIQTINCVRGIAKSQCTNISAGG